MARKQTQTQGNKSALIYCRVSTKGQQEEGTSLETQADACIRHAESLGYTVGRITKEVYSGAELWDRPQLSTDRADIKAGNFQALICYATDRLSREPVHLFILAEECARSGVELIFVTEPLDNSNEGQLIQYVRGYASKVEREKIKERSLRGKIAKLKSGKLIPSRRPLYGYHNDAVLGKRVIYEPEAKIVRMIYEWCAQGHGAPTIKNRLFEMNIMPPEGHTLDDGHARLWPVSTILNILRSRAYKGETYQWQYQTAGPKQSSRKPKEEHIKLPDGVTPPIVAEELWNTVQHRIDTNRGDNARNKKRQYLLRGLVYCATCGRKMYSDRAHGFSYYRCSSRTLDGAPCSSGMGRADKIEGEVWQAIADFLADPERSLNELRQTLKNGPDPQLLEDRETALRRIGEIERIQARLIRRLRDTEEDDIVKLYEREIVQVRQEKESIEETLRDIESRIASSSKAALDLDSLGEYCARVSGALSTFSFEEKRLAIEACGATVQIKGNEWKLETRFHVGEAFASSIR